MNIRSQISVGNNVTLGFKKVDIETNCHGFVTIKIPQGKSGTFLEVELHRAELREFLARTCPAFQQIENYAASKDPTQ